MNYFFEGRTSRTSHHLMFVANGVIWTEDCYNYGGQCTHLKTIPYHAYWSIEHKDRCPDYSGYEIAKVAKLLKLN
jgi:hypothetical protein